MRDNSQEFEDEVRRVARLLWPEAEFGGATIESGKERDGVFEGGDFIHVVEATTSRAKDKATKDGSKVGKLVRRLISKNPEKFVKGWFVTKNEPTAAQRDEILRIARSKGPNIQIVATSFDQFRSKLVDAREYIQKRWNYPFGSVADPNTGATDYAPDYITLSLVDAEGQSRTLLDITQGLLDDQRIVLVGDYGAGKSSTLREMFNLLADHFHKGKTLSFPVILNLRDHHGQTDHVEALERHARRVGYKRASDLVSAYHAGYVVLFLDGFDEIASAGWAAKSTSLRQLRHQSMTLIREFVRHARGGILVAGREHFFDSYSELRSALAMRPSDHFLELTEFDVAQVAQFLAQRGRQQAIPTWLPSRPLLLAYLATNDLLPPAGAENETTYPAIGWSKLIDRICAREAELESGMDADTVLSLVQFLALFARATTGGVGPLLQDQIVDAYLLASGTMPDDKGVVLLQRLPGLGATSQEDGSRSFVSRDFADAARGAAICAHVINPYDQPYDPSTWQEAISPLAAEIALERCKDNGVSVGHISAAIEEAKNQAGADVLLADLLLMLMLAEGEFAVKPTYVRETIIPELPLDELVGDMGRIEFQDCLISVVQLGSDYDTSKLPRFVNCDIGRVLGCTGERDLPADRFLDCQVDEFEEHDMTTSSLLQIDMPKGCAVLLTILKKLYLQGGVGRREGALYRGLDQDSRLLVPAILQLLQRYEFAFKARHRRQTLWLPAKGGSYRQRALAILAAPHASGDVLIASARRLNN